MAHTLSPSEQLAHCTVRIDVETPQGVRGTGTGFFYRFAQNGEHFVPAVVANRHLVEGAARGRFHVILAGADGSPDYAARETFSFDNFHQYWVPHPDPAVDLCAMPIGPLVTAAQVAGKAFFYLTVDPSLLPTDRQVADFAALEDVVVVGYPNGLWDREHNLPVFRRGITATHPALDWNGRPEFLIDGPCIAGSAGSPVFLLNIGGYATKSRGMVAGRSRMKLLGVLHAAPQQLPNGELRIMPVPTADHPLVLGTAGVVVKARKLNELDAAVTALLAQAQPPQAPPPRGEAAQAPAASR
jgi:hypothetical protein